MWSVRFEDVSKRYRKGGAKYSTLGGELGDLVGRVGARLRGKRSEPRGTLALEHVSFEVGEGESFALIGPNGAGKTTALRMLARISVPTGGVIRGRGRVGALMEVGSGVHTELTGRENVWLYGSILGIPRSEIRRRFDEIVGFAELAHAIDTPVKYYSSGMQLRLGFAIASHLEPDIFVVDEALSVGDANFQDKCVQRMAKLVRGGTTVLFVSHDLSAVESICDRAILIEHGREVTQGPVREVLTHYLTSIEGHRIDLASNEDNVGTVKITGASCHGPDGDERYTFASRGPIEIRLEFEAEREVVRPNVKVSITDGAADLIECTTLEDGQAPALVGRQWECRLHIDELPLRPRLYEIWVEVWEESGRGMLMKWIEVARFRVEGDPGAGPQAVVIGAQGGAVAVPYHWDVRS